MAGWDLTASPRAAEGGGTGEVLTVSAAVKIAAGALDAIPQLTVVGEVTGFRGPNPRSGHCYFQIKDASAAVDAIIWRGVYAHAPFELRDGMKVQFTGKFNLYEPSGRMSFVARSFSLVGEGLLRQQVAELAEKLRREGLMEQARKRPIPAFCSRVAVVTSLHAAVINDVRRTLVAHNPLVELMCVDSQVQGAGAPEQLIEGLRRAAAIAPAPDCILLVRGGGSYEDLMTFNDEALARAVAACPVPVVTGIGHEPDNTICDMVADRRCPTPTAAASSVAPAMGDLENVLAARAQRLASSMQSAARSASVETGLLAERVSRAWGESLGRFQRALDAAAQRPCLTSPAFMVERRQMELEQTAERLAAGIERSQTRFSMALSSFPVRLRHEGEALLARRQSALGASAASLDALSPLKVLGRGYAIVYTDAGVATSASSFKEGEGLRVRLADGEVRGVVTSTEPDERPAATIEREI